ncbi:MAG: hypothetical protein ACYTG7_10160 [Planctomycetota bacterium]|jgi:hypothetical protein
MKKTVIACFLLCLLFGLTQAFPQDELSLTKKELGKLSETMKEFIDARFEDDRSKELETKQELQALVGEIEKNYEVDDLLKKCNLWHRIREGTIKPDPKNKALKSKGRGFQRGEYKDYTEVDERSYVFYISLPKEYDTKKDTRFPVIIFLHPEVTGRGKPDKETLKLLKKVYSDEELLSKYIIFAPIGPILGGRKKEFKDAGKDWESLEYGRKTAFMAIRVLMEQMVFDRSKVFLDGMGKAGLSACKYATWYPSFFAGIISRDAPIAPVAIENAKGIPFLYVSSSENANKDGAKKWADEFKEGDPSQVTLLEDAGTCAEPSVEAWASIKEWINNIDKNTTPDSIFMKTSDLATAGAYWLRIEDLNAGLNMKLDDPKYPWVQAAVDREANTIVVDSENILKIRVFLSDKILDLDKKVTIVLNGNKRFEGTVQRSLDKMLDLVYYNLAGDFEIYCNSQEISEEL